MGFAPVKSDPYGKGRARRRGAFRLWSDQFWKRICQQEEEHCCSSSRQVRMTEETARMIAEMNLLLYGSQ